MKLYYYILFIPLINYVYVTLLLALIFLFFLTQLFLTLKKSPLELENKRSIKLIILVPVFNEEDNLLNIIECFSNNQKSFQVVFINDFSTDNSLKILEENITKFKYHICNRTEKKGFVAGVLNDGLKYVETNCYVETNLTGVINHNIFINYIGVINADCYFDKNTIDKVIDKLETFDIDVLNLSNEASVIKTLGHTIGNLEKIFKNNLSKNVEVGLNNGYFIKKKSLLSVNGWKDNELTEDLNLTLKLKKKNNIFYQSDLYVSDHIPDTLKGLFNQKYRWLKGDITNRISTTPKNLFDIIVNIYYIFPLLTLFAFFIIPFIFLERIFLLQIFISLIETIMFYKFDNYRNFFKAMQYSLTQFVFAIYFYLRYGLENEDKW
jgi:hypothetical protein